MNLNLLRKITEISNVNHDMKKELLDILYKPNIIDFYNFIVLKNAILLIPKSLNMSNIIVTSSHYDSVYSKSFFSNKNERILIGTFDNSIGVYINILLANKKYNNVILAFTGCEETDRQGIYEVTRYFGSSRIKNMKYIVFDVTTELVDVSTTIENCNIDEPIEYKDIKYVDNDICGYDEAAYLMENGYITMSVCCVLEIIDEINDCHSEAGCCIDKNNIKKYYNNVVKILNKFGGKNECISSKVKR